MTRIKTIDPIEYHANVKNSPLKALSLRSPVTYAQYHRPDYYDQGSYTTRAVMIIPSHGSDGTLLRTPSGYDETWKAPETDFDSFKAIQKSGEIKFSQYSVGSIKVRYHVSTVVDQSTRVTISLRKESTRGGWKIDSAGSSANDPSSSSGKNYLELSAPLIKLGRKTQYSTEPELLHYNPYSSLMRSDPHFSIEKSYGWANKTGSHYAAGMPEFPSQISYHQTAVAKKLRVGWDAATDLAEIRSTIKTGASLLRRASGLMFDLRKQLRNAGPKGDAAASIWLEFRYGIMPVLYSARDLMETVDAKKAQHRYDSARSSFTEHIDEVGQYPENRACTYDSINGTVHYRFLGKAFFATPRSRLNYKTSMNLPNALWETLRYSLIVDWLSNFGMWLHAQTFHKPGNVKEAFMYSVKKNYIKNTYQRVQVNGVWTDHLIKSETVSTYDRYPFDPKDAQLTANVRLSNWMRQMDALAMSIKPLFKALRRLR